jgi:drug/metabolite transporter superfamily protein YnfA
MDYSQPSATKQTFGGAADASSSTSAPHPVDNTDWLKAAAIILVAIDHFGHFFMEDDRWWSVLGRPAAPTFFFLLGYADTRRVPLLWVALGIILTLLNSWNASWTWVAPNILLSFVFIRLIRPYARAVLQRFGFAALVVLVCALIAMLPVTGKIFDYGAEGWLWALFGLCQRMYVDGKPLTKADWQGGSTSRMSAINANANLMRLFACLVAAAVYVWQEQLEYRFREPYYAVFVLGIALLSASLLLFRRGPSRIQLPRTMSYVLHFIGRHTLEIYAIQLAGSELLIKFFPDLAS